MLIEFKEKYRYLYDVFLSDQASLDDYDHRYFLRLREANSKFISQYEIIDSAASAFLNTTMHESELIFISALPERLEITFDDFMMVDFIGAILDFSQKNLEATLGRPIFPVSFIFTRNLTWNLNRFSLEGELEDCAHLDRYLYRCNFGSDEVGCLDVDNVRIAFTLDSTYSHGYNHLLEVSARHLEFAAPLESIQGILSDDVLGPIMIDYLKLRMSGCCFMDRSEKRDFIRERINGRT